MKIIQAKLDDLNTIVEILRDGRNQLAERGVDQWQGDYPNEEHVRQDILNGYAYLVQSDDTETVGTVAIVPAPDPVYDHINGQWLIDTNKFVAIHRVAIHSNHAGKGYASQLFVAVIHHLASNHPDIESIRLSTNENNLAMQRVATKNGFQKVGTMPSAFRPSELSFVYELLTHTQKNELAG